MQDVLFPSKRSLEEATIRALKHEGGTASTKVINAFVADDLKLSKEILEIEDETGCGKKYHVRMRWCRTTLKNNGKIERVGKAIWRLL